MTVRLTIILHIVLPEPLLVSVSGELVVRRADVGDKLRTVTLDVEVRGPYSVSLLRAVQIKLHVTS